MAQLNYITLSQLMASVESDLKSFADNGMIDRGDVVKVVRKVNADLGLKIYKENQALIDIDNYKGDLPADFMSLQLAVACNIEHAFVGPGIHGTHTVETNVPVVPNQAACMNENGGCYWVTQKYKDTVVSYNRFTQLKLAPGAKRFASENCINFNWDKSGYDIDIVNGQIFTGFREGKIYINYLADMIDENGELTLLDHPLVQEYYEYSVKKQLLENYMLNNDADVSNKLGYIKNELRDAKIRALNFITTPEYSEIVKMYTRERRRFYDKYHRIIG